MSTPMQDVLVYGIGFTAQILFSWRMISQWLLSERNKRTEVPKWFWMHSLLASILLFVYGWLRDDFAIILGQTLTYFIYIRNLQFQGEWRRLNRGLRSFILIFPVLIIFYSFHNQQIDLHRFFKNEDIPLWLVVLGSLGQIIFTGRFVYQWIHSERRKMSLLPMPFWLISLCGSLLILVYAVIRRDPVLFIGQLFGFIVYFRNMVIARRVLVLND